MKIRFLSLPTRNVLFGTLILLSRLLPAEESTLRDDVIGAAAKLADKSNYSWRSTIEITGGIKRAGDSTEGRAGEGGLTWISMTHDANSVEALMKGDKGVVKTPDGWQFISKAADGDIDVNFATFLGRLIAPGERVFNASMGLKALAGRMWSSKDPVARAKSFASRGLQLKKVGDAFVSDLSEEDAKLELTFGIAPPGGGNGPKINGAKGSVTFWIKEGVLSKYEIKVKGTLSLNGKDHDMGHTVTVEIKDVGTTRIEAPEDAKKKVA